MTIEKRTNADLVNLNWGPWTSDMDGSFSADIMRTAAAMHGAKQGQLAAERLLRCMYALEGIVSSLDAIGRDGIHVLVKELAREAQAKKKRRLARRRAKR